MSIEHTIANMLQSNQIYWYLMMNCKNCNTPSPPNARFCPNCGRPLTTEAVPVAQTAGAFNQDRYLPRELASKLEALRTSGGMSGERRIITMLFCDVKGSTAAAEQLDPEEWTEIINGIFEHMIRPIYKYEGMVPRLMGDAILAFFGAPIAHEDDPQRAVLAGLEIQASIQPYAEEIRKRFGVSFALRVGINTGLVVVGEVGSDLRMEYTAIGDAINLAARMEQTAVPGSVQISDETYKLVAPFFECESLGGMEVKGKSKPVNSYRVLSVKETPGQLRRLEGLTSPLVGREAEISAFEELLAALQNGQGSAVTLLGEAGLGKSSLVNTVHSNLDSASTAWLEAHALSYTQSVSYFSWRQIFRSSIGASESEAPPEVRAKLRTVWNHRELSADELPFLEAILAVESQESLQKITGYQGDALLQRIISAARAYLCATARAMPLTIVFDDLHWMDEASLTLLFNLVDLVEENPILFLCLTRPERDTPAWDFVQRIQRNLPACSRQIELQPFSSETTNALLVNLLGPRDLPKSLYNQIIQKAEGNPFFVEEIIRSLIETGQIVRTNGDWHAAESTIKISLPKTLSGVLSARIDRLPDQAKQILHFASVIGRSFDMHTLSAMASPVNSIDAHIQTLEHAGLIQKVTGSAQAEYTFRHALIQEAAYNSILLKRRRALHTRVGEYLEATYAERLNEFAPILAHHFYAARDSRSLLYDETAGKNAMRLYANVEAVTHFNRALEVAQRIDAPLEQIEELYKNLGQALELSGRYEEALENYDRMETFAQERNFPAMQVAALTAKATIYSIFSRVHSSALSEQMLIKALAISEGVGDRAIQARLHWNLMLNYLFSKRLDQALEHGQLALGFARESDDREQLAFVLNDLCRLYTTRGEFEKALPMIQEARELWKALDNQIMLADSFGSEGEARFNAGEFEQAFELCTEALRISEKTENLWGQSYDRMLLSFVQLEKGELSQGIQLAEQSVQLADDAGLIASSIGMRSELAWEYAYCGASEKGLSLVEQALEVAEAKQPAWKAFPQAAKIRIYLLQGNVRAAEQFAGNTLFEPISIPYARYIIFLCLANIELAISKGDHQLGLSLIKDLLNEVSPLTRVDIPDVLRWKGKALFAHGNLEEAHRTLTLARSLAEGLGAKPQLWPILESLETVNAKLGNVKEAGENRREAHRIIEQIAESLQEIRFSQSFLKQPRVRALMRR
jgi:class 3 adenylate cyclase/tetratricopeptide (TPR) repeat protein